MCWSLNQENYKSIHFGSSWILSWFCVFTASHIIIKKQLFFFKDLLFFVTNFSQVE